VSEQTIPRVIWEDETGKRRVLQDVTGLIVQLWVGGQWARVGQHAKALPINQGGVPYLELAIALEALDGLMEKWLQSQAELSAYKNFNALLHARLDKAREELETCLPIKTPESGAAQSRSTPCPQESSESMTSS